MSLRTPCALLLISSCLLAGCWGDKKPKSPPSFDNDPLFKEVITLVQEKYIKEPDLNKMRMGALSGMLSALDSYSAYLPPDSYEALADSTDGEFGGIGVEVYPVESGVKVISAIDDTPAAKAGLQAGDIIVAIDDKPTFTMTYSEIISSLHGSPQTAIKITVQRGEEEVDFSIERRTVVINPVKLIIKDGIAYLRISYFNHMVASRLQEAIETLQKSKADIIGIVLDLRNNPGGVMEQAVKTVGYFIKSGIVTQVIDRSQKIKTIKAEEAVTFPDIPVVVIINNGSASASEIVASALKYHERAIILGKRSHGKGSVQSVFPIPGSGGVKLTTARFLTPAGEELNGKGIQPDITVDSPSTMLNVSLFSPKGINDDDVQLNRSFEILKSIASMKRWKQ
ncbi:S41 family peptidase [Candidatus Odyssella acanthamoebae]|uniref:S41 family peptidase n=1 Tax=Candidatus Odyssella acanthamoebae TaxID=91604 RepID=UPI00068D150E|nr:S41 family peptidase [Candidatus Paracaedibacter acanthamoebae]